ncbi:MULTISPECIES: anthranilate phosphoribosyltransferase [Brevibacillus]|jgi:anthranilate phosphoribosyltransferase|uniref:Anthranilate phosphoribosyltransferase n=1 Tax=Brevibacillus aydinogluensis TaxID=927786 RepID=A0AA48MC21_9BACL|nr:MULTISPECIES: anthranilate phosphoribosyltransferase [Bacillales]MDT3417064.1 anthranilate phosphoribosyltransferase [Brevibacillus aydinogluensis]REK62692.1 MAG: anthranilate phosphoribosyltransferase [Brevibacillus sp.]UFJ59672.1 anthranilate phosphoribosyltransferase [Anoxybacillus sediminis]CAJ1003733.1 Anthranilate phosphoribosyltransferase [Brevibacillus aydinogluensis]
MYELLKEVGRGKRGAKDLTYEQATIAAEMFLNGSATPAQMGAFLMAERIKSESLDELAAFVEVLRRTMSPVSFPDSLDCAGPYDGRRKSFMATLPAAFVLAACGQRVTLHGSPSLPPKWGITLTDVLKTAGVSVDAADRQALLSAAERSGVLIVPTETWCPALHKLRPLRLELGVRTLFNTVEKLLRPADSPSMAIGIFHGTVFEKVAELLLRLGVERGIVVQGMEGSEDVSAAKPSRALIVENGSCRPFVVDPASLGLQAEAPDTDWTPELQRQTAEAVLNGTAEPAYRNMVLLNSALRLWITGRVPNLDEGVAAARQALDSREAWDRYRQWLDAAAPSAAPAASARDAGHIGT